MIKKVTIIGLGLIGGSIARSLKALNPSIKILAHDIDSNALKFALQHNWIDHAISTITSEVKHSDIIIIATPPEKFNDILLLTQPFLDSKTIVTDCVSVKSHIVGQARNILGNLFSNFVPGHPIAGSERAGIQNAHEKLFQNRTTLLTPEQETAKAALDVITQFWQSLGAKVIYMPAEEHDKILAYTSHLPHLLAFVFLKSAPLDKIDTIKQCIGKGFEDFSRIGGANPSLWCDIFFGNQKYVLEQLNHFKEQLNKLEQALTNNDTAELIEIIGSSVASKKRLS